MRKQHSVFNHSGSMGILMSSFAFWEGGIHFWEGGIPSHKAKNDVILEAKKQTNNCTADLGIYGGDEKGSQDTRIYPGYT